jgi:hypothetical protein
LRLPTAVANQRRWAPGLEWAGGPRRGRDVQKKPGSSTQDPPWRRPCLIPPTYVNERTTTLFCLVSFPASFRFAVARSDHRVWNLIMFVNKWRQLGWHRWQNARSTGFCNLPTIRHMVLETPQGCESFAWENSPCTKRYGSRADTGCPTAMCSTSDPFYLDAQCCNQPYPLESFWKPAQYFAGSLGVGKRRVRRRPTEQVPWSLTW